LDPSPHYNKLEWYNDSIKGSFINDSIERVFREIDGTSIHLKIFEIGSFVFAAFGHGFSGGLRDVDIGDGLIAIIEHLLTQSYVMRGILEFPEPTFNIRL
jgi:hypothetical protein